MPCSAHLHRLLIPPTNGKTITVMVMLVMIVVMITVITITAVTMTIPTAAGLRRR